MKSSIKAGLVIGAIGLGTSLSGVHISHAQSDPPAAFQGLDECAEMLPENKQFSMSIDINIDTSEGGRSEIQAILLDDAVPESVDIPEGTEGFQRCFLGILGISDEQI